MSFFVSESIKDRLDEETFLEKESNNEIVIDHTNFIKIKNKKNGNAIIDINLSPDQLGKLYSIELLSVKMLNNAYEKIRVKQIIKDCDKYKCRLICKEKKIENNK